MNERMREKEKGRERERERGVKRGDKQARQELKLLFQLFPNSANHQNNFGNFVGICYFILIL
jgi:SNF family Na+-dependent transporter